MLGDDNGLPFVWNASTGLTTIPLPVNAMDGAATGISDSGVVVGYYTSGQFPPFPRTAFIYFPGQGMMDLTAYLNSINTVGVGLPGTPVGISRNGRYISGNTSGFPVKGFFIDLGPSSTTSIASISNVSVLDLNAYPNPCANEEVHFSFSVPTASAATMTILDRSGKVVRRISGLNVVSGKNNISWNRLSEDGQRVAAGSYSVVIEAGSMSAKVLLVLL